MNYRLRGRPNEVDAVLQRVRETVWRKADTYNPSRGCAGAFVFGITRNVVRHELERRVIPTEELTESTACSREPDPLQVLLSRFDAHRWMSLVSDFVGGDDWGLIAELAFLDNDCDELCARRHVAPRTVRTIRDRVALVASTVRAALASADADLPLTGSVLLGCVPARGGYRDVAAMLDCDAPTIAATLGIHPGSARARIATARRLLHIAQVVLEQELAL